MVHIIVISDIVASYVAEMVSLQQLISFCGYCINFLSSFEPIRNSEVFKMVNVSSVVTPTS